MYLRVKVVFIDCREDPTNTAVSSEHNDTKLLKPLEQLQPFYDNI